MDFYTEQLYKKKKRPLDYLMQAGIFVGCLAASSLVFILLSAVAPAFGKLAGTLAIVAIVYGAYKLFCRLDTEYEYIYFNGELDVDKITAKSDRKRLLTVKCQEFERFGRATEGIREKVTADKVLDVTSGGESPVYFAVFHKKDAGRMLLLFEPKEEIRADMKRRMQITTED